MPPIYYCILTTLGLNKFAAAQAGGPAVDIAELAVGDGNGNYYEPVAGQVGLVLEVWRGALNRLYVHPNNASWVVAEALIPAAAGGFEIREAGLFDGAGDLLAVGKYPLTVKPAPGSGSEKDLYVRMVLQVANAAEVTQTIDPSLVLATKEYVDSRDWRESARAATVAAIADLAAGAPDTLDGVALAVGDRVLVKDQAAAAQNGIYTVQALGAGADGVWTRSADADSGLEVSANFTVAVEEGAVNADSIWMLTANAPITLGATALLFRRLITQAELDAHASRADNPHGVTAEQAGADPVGTAAAERAAHEAAADPHPQYDTGAEAQARVAAAVAALVDASPAALDTLAELAAALGGDPDFATTMINALAGKEPKFPAGTKMVFVQAAAPAGWVTDVTVSYSAAGLRIVTDGSGGGAGGASDAFAAHTHSVPAHGHGHTLSVQSHALTVNEMPGHNHPGSSTNSAGAHTHSLPFDASSIQGAGAANVTQQGDPPQATTGPGGDHTHPLTIASQGGGAGHTHGLAGGISNDGGGVSGTFAPKYVNAIICVKQ